MQKQMQSISRLTVSVPPDMSHVIDEVKDELHVTRSEVVRMAVEMFVHERRKQNLRKAADLMNEEYKTNSELTAFTVLDGEDFK